MGQWWRSLARLPPASLFATKKDPQAARRVHHNNWPGRARLEGIDGSCTTLFNDDPTPSSASLRSDIRELDHLRPPLGLLSDELSEFRR